MQYIHNTTYKMTSSAKKNTVESLVDSIIEYNVGLLTDAMIKFVDTVNEIWEREDTYDVDKIRKYAEKLMEKDWNDEDYASCLETRLAFHRETGVQLVCNTEDIWEDIVYKVLCNT